MTEKQVNNQSVTQPYPNAEVSALYMDPLMHRFYFRGQGAWLSAGLAVFLLLIQVAPDAPLVFDPSVVVAQYYSPVRGIIEVMTRIGALEFVWVFFFQLFYLRSWPTAANVLLLFSVGFVLWSCLNAGLLDYISEFLEALPRPSPYFPQRAIFNAIAFVVLTNTFILLCPSFVNLVIGEFDKKIPDGLDVFWFYEIVAFAAAALAGLDYAGLNGGDPLHLGRLGHSMIPLSVAVGCVTMATIGYGWGLDRKLARLKTHLAGVGEQNSDRGPN